MAKAQCDCTKNWIKVETVFFFAVRFANNWHANFIERRTENKLLKKAPQYRSSIGRGYLTFGQGPVEVLKLLTTAMS